jgi:DNA-binding winged helix-turn-helix (wHTH) protein/TolB-like protein/Tfp pilus assembly protein PilF
MSTEMPHFYEFGPFRLDPSTPLLMREGRPVSLTLKALETLVVLVERGGRVVSREKLIEAVWPDTVVEENNLSVNVSMLRKALGEGENGENYIETVPRRGYRFTASVWHVPAGSVQITNILRSRENVIGPGSVESSTGVVLEEMTDGSWRATNNSMNQRSRKWSRIFAAFSVCLAAVVAGYFYVRLRSQAKENANVSLVRSIAVLPLKAITKNEGDETLSLGLAESLITRLASSQKIIVRPLSLTTQYTRAGSDPLAVGHRLQVDAVLEGSFQRKDNHLRVRIRLWLVADGKQIWSGTFDEIEPDIFKLQDAISLEAASALALSLNQPERELILKRYTENFEAYQAYLRGRYFISKRDDEENYNRAFAEYERAIQLDRDYALAYAGLADAYSRKANVSSDDERKQLYEKSKAAAHTALALDENLAEAHAALGWVLRIYDWNWTESEKHIKRAIELAPNEADCRRLYALLLITLGRTAEAITQARKGVALNPTYTSAYALALSSNRQVDEAIVEYDKLVEMNEDQSAWHALAQLYLFKGNYVEALQVINQTPPKEQERFRTKMITTMIYFHSGDREKAGELLRELEARANVTDGCDVRLAAVYGSLGRKEDAISALQKGLAARDDRLMWIKTNPHFDSLRNDPRFHKILQSMKL